MGEQCCLNLRPGNVVAGRDDHVVRARGKVEYAILVAHEVVTRQVPAIAHVAELPVIGKVATPGWAAHGKMSDAPISDLAHGIVDDARLVSLDRPAGSTGPG